MELETTQTPSPRTRARPQTPMETELAITPMTTQTETAFLTNQWTRWMVVTAVEYSPDSRPSPAWHLC